MVIACVIEFVGLVMALVGQSTDHWVIARYDGSSVHKGLYDCDVSSCSSWTKAVQATTILGILVNAVGVGMHIAFIWENIRTWLLHKGALILLGGAFINLIGIVIYAVEHRYYLPDSYARKVGWSFGLTTMSSMVMNVGSGMAIILAPCIAPHYGVN